VGRVQALELELQRSWGTGGGPQENASASAQETPHRPLSPGLSSTQGESRAWGKALCPGRRSLNRDPRKMLSVIQQASPVLQLWQLQTAQVGRVRLERARLERGRVQRGTVQRDTVQRDRVWKDRLGKKQNGERQAGSEGIQSSAASLASGGAQQGQAGVGTQP